MALFKKEEETQAQEAASAPAAKEGGKGRPTPKRKEAQAQNLRPLVPQNTKEQRQRAKARQRAKENEEYEAMKAGDINKMPKAERLPWRVYIRDYVDARFNIGEYFIPVAIVILVLCVLVTIVWPSPMISLILMMIMYIYLFAIIIDVAVMWHKLKKQLVAKFGEASVARGSRSGSYAWSRAIQLRRWRLPKPKYKERGHWPK